jgi:hypothetical protein
VNLVFTVNFMIIGLSGISYFVLIVRLSPALANKHVYIYIHIVYISTMFISLTDAST